MLRLRQGRWWSLSHSAEGGLSMFALRIIVRRIVGEYEQRAVYKYYSWLWFDNVLETSGAIYRVKPEHIRSQNKVIKKG